VLIVVLAGIGIGGFIWYQNVQKFISVLVFSKTVEFRHESIEAGVKALVDLGAKYVFKVEATEDTIVFENY